MKKQFLKYGYLFYSGAIRAQDGSIFLKIFFLHF